MDVEGKGTILFFFLIKCKNGKFNQIVWKNILYNLKLRRNLLSGIQLEKLLINFVGNKSKVFVTGKDMNFLML